jgi:type II secretory pathway pseudopilin PulG
MPSRVRHGFVLLEAVVALLIIGLATAGALELYSAHARAATRQPALLTAAALAQDRMTAVRLLPPEQLRRLADSLARGQFAEPFAAYRWQASAERARNGHVYDIRVDVFWRDGDYTLVTSAAAPPREEVRP